MLGAAAIIYNYCWLAITTIIAIIAIANIIASTTAIATTEIKLLTLCSVRRRQGTCAQQRVSIKAKSKKNNKATAVEEAIMKLGAGLGLPGSWCCFFLVYGADFLW